MCDGYSQAMVLLCRLSGIPCSILQGDACSEGVWGSHAWVLLCLDGSYTQCDITWDDSSDDRLYGYYNVSDDMIASTHVRYADFAALPSCTDTGLTWHALTGNVAPTGV